MRSMRDHKQIVDHAAADSLKNQEFEENMVWCAGVSIHSTYYIKINVYLQLALILITYHTKRNVLLTINTSNDTDLG